MYLLSGLPSLSRTTRLNRRRRFPNRLARPRFIRPRLEALEDRTVPSTVTWVGGTSGDWDTASNWSTGALPGAKDDVVINTANATITHIQGSLETIHTLQLASTDTLNWSNGTLNLTAASTLSGTVDLSGGTWEGAGNLTLDGVFNWNGNGSELYGSGSTTVGAGATMNLGGNGAQILNGRKFYNKGTTNWLANSYMLRLDNGALFDNETGATFNANSPGTAPTTQLIYNSVGAAGTFTNAGTFNNNAGNGNTTEFANVLFNNKGTVNDNTGELLLLDGGTDSAGTFYVPVGAALWFGNGVTSLASAIGSSTNKAAGVVNFNGGTTTITGAINDTGNFTIDIAGGLVNFDNKADSIPYLTMAGGTLSGSAAVTVTATTGTALTWNGYSTMSGIGSTTLNTGAVMSLGGNAATQTLDQRTFNNKGTVNWLAGSSTLYLNDGAIFNNEVGAAFNANSPGSGPATQYINVLNNYPSGTFTNAGTFTNNAGSGNTTEIENVFFNNSGTVNANSGTLLLDSGGTDSKGTFYVPAAGTLQFSGVTSLASAIGSSTNKAAGTLAFSGGTTTLTGSLYDTGNFTIAISGGTADFEKAVSIPYLNLTGTGLNVGTLTGSAAVTVTNTLSCVGDVTMSGPGSTTLASGATMTLPNGAYLLVLTLDGRTFNNQGTVNVYSELDASLADGAVFNNESGANFNINVPANITFGSDGTGTFVNAGTLLVTGSSTTTFESVAFNNTGTVNITGALLGLSGGTSTGSFVDSGDLYFSGGINNLNAPTTSVTGSGQVEIEGGEVDFGGTYHITGLTDIGGGTVNFLNGGSTGTFDNYANGGIVELAGGTTFSVTSGNYTQSAGSTYLNGATLAVTGSNTVDIQSRSYLIGPGAITGNLSNEGSVYVGGGQNLTGTLSVSGNYTQSSFGVLLFNIGGPTAGTQYDQLNIGGSATLAGTLDITLVNGYSPSSGTQFTIMTYASRSGDFTTKNLNGLSSTTPGSTTYLVTA